MVQLGIDLGGTTITAGVVEGESRVLSRKTRPTRPERPVEDVIQEICRCGLEALEACGHSPQTCSWVGMGCPGTCDPEVGKVSRAHNLGWFDVPVVSLLEERLGLPVFLENDGNCALLGELTAGAGKGCETVLLVTLGTGIGGGIAAEGRLLAGYHSLGGELGHICIAMDGARCTCGERGCWEAYASATALIRQGEGAAAQAPESLLARRMPLDGEKIYGAAQQGDRTAQAVIARYARYVGVGLVNLSNVLFPERVLLGGGISGAGEALLHPVREYVAQHLFVRGEGAPQIRLASLGSDAGLLGAAALGRQPKQH